ncbi:MAG: hypothetical protein N3A53_01760 [Verrucomicrobiae bacterium]|nr:hypothetical protein [Verrucomicrobiae bacterium]
MVTFSCSSCSVLITVVDDLRGRSARCPACQHLVVVPLDGKNGVQPVALIPPRCVADAKHDVIQRAWLDVPVSELGRRMIQCLLGGLLAQRHHFRI